MNYKSILGYSRYVFYALIGILLCSCSKNDNNSPINISEEWVVDKFNGNIILTNNIIVYEINSPTTLRKSLRNTGNEKNYTTEILGLWEGKCITATESDEPHRWQYRSDGTYSYFSKDSNDRWKEKEDNASKYTLHGKFLITS